MTGVVVDDVVEGPDSMQLSQQDSGLHSGLARA